jgi:hypothetical protein
VIRATWRGDPFIAAAVHERTEKVVEHHSVRDAPTVTAPGVGDDELGALLGADQRGELDSQRLDQGCWQPRHGPSKRSSGPQQA